MIREQSKSNRIKINQNENKMIRQSELKFANQNDKILSEGLLQIYVEREKFLIARIFSRKFLRIKISVKIKLRIISKNITVNLKIGFNIKSILRLFGYAYSVRQPRS